MSIESFDFPEIAVPPGVGPEYIPARRESRRLARLLPLPEMACPVRLPDGSEFGKPLLLTAGRLGVYHAFIGYELAADSEDRPSGLTDALFLLFLCAHDPGTWLHSPAAGVPPLERDVDEFRAVIAEWSDALPTSRAAQLALLDAAQRLWDYHCLNRPVPDPDPEAQKKTMRTSSPSGRPSKRKQSGSSPAATLPGKRKSSGAGRSVTTTPRSIAAGSRAESPSSRKRKPSGKS